MSKSKTSDSTDVPKDPRGTLYGLPDEHMAETGLLEPDGERHPATRELRPGEVERDEQGRPVALGLDLETAETMATPEHQARNRHTDVGGMLRRLGLERYDPLAFRDSGRGWGVVDDLLEHWWLNTPDQQTAGGPFAFVNGPPGKGKSTFFRGLAVRSAENNGQRLGEKVIWRGSPSRCEWDALAPWARLVLPENANVTASLNPVRPTDEPLRDVDLSNYVREVVRYSGPVDALEKCRAGGINVVYPDPSFHGCEALYRDIPSRRASEIADRDELFASGDPLPHWWIAALLAAVDGRESGTPISFLFDEIKDIAPESAAKDNYGTYQKVHELGGDLSADLRKYGVSLYAAGHGESAVSSEWRNKIHYRVHTAGREAPQSAAGLKGFDETPFYHNVNKSKSPGEGVVFDSENFEEITWSNVSSPIPRFDLQIRVRVS
jgi:hypothetical protein